MTHVIEITTKLFNALLVSNGSTSVLERLLYDIVNFPILFIGTVLIVIGFVVGIIHRMIKS